MSKMWSRNLHIYKNGIILIKVLTIVCQLILTSNYYSTYQRPRASRLVTINKFISCVAEYIEIFPCWHFRFLSVRSYSTIDVCRELSITLCMEFHRACFSHLQPLRLHGVFTWHLQTPRERWDIPVACEHHLAPVRAIYR